MTVFSTSKQLALSLLSLLCLGLVLGACSTAPPMPTSQPMPTGKNFTGVWYSPQFEHMNLRQTGDRVAGIYTYQNGGRIEGTVDGNMLTFTWVEPGDKTRARREMNGRGYLQLVKATDGKHDYKLVGEWGYGENIQGGGPWKATWVRDLLPEDPQTLKKLKDQRN